VCLNTFKGSILVPDWDHATEVKKKKKKKLVWQDICVSNSFKGYLHDEFLCYMFNDLFILFCRQTLSLRPSATTGRRFCHQLPQNGDNSRKT